MVSSAPPGRPAPIHVSGSDPLPTAEAVALVKGFAARACAAMAADCVWRSTWTAATWMKRTPLVALGVLIRLCPEVAPSRLASCLGLEPAAVGNLHNMQVQQQLPDGLVDAIARDVLGRPW